MFFKKQENINWATGNNGFPLEDDEVNKLVSVLPQQRQIEHEKQPFYLFMHFGMNTSTGREWGNGTETVADFKITHIDVAQWADAAIKCGASGIILTAKHHDGFCLWDTKMTDFNIMNTGLKTDIVALLSSECRKRGLNFGVYLSPWDMHEESYGTEKYNDYFCGQLTELLINYGKIFEVWFDGAKGKNAKKFEYDWQRYYKIIRQLQPDACISICGPDLRWVGNEGGKCRKNEFSVVPSYLTMAETTHERSQQSEDDAETLKKFESSDEDLGSRVALKNADDLTWYPAEVDVSIRKGWFHPGGGKVKSAKKLFKLYLASVGNNCSLLLNVPPNKDGVVDVKDMKSLVGLGAKLKKNFGEMKAEFKPGKLEKQAPVLQLNLPKKQKYRYCIIEEDIAFGQRIEKFDLYLISAHGIIKRRCRGTIIGARKIIKINAKCSKTELIIRQSRSNPIIKSVKFY